MLPLLAVTVPLFVKTKEEPGAPTPLTVIVPPEMVLPDSFVRAVPDIETVWLPAFIPADVTGAPLAPEALRVTVPLFAPVTAELLIGPTFSSPLAEVTDISPLDAPAALPDVAPVKMPLPIEALMPDMLTPPPEMAEGAEVTKV
jgi:hypothetical protein